jgi:NADPH-dependent 2,4-dienoyl-CoA reductase/sulfur reductase-like enzyme
VTQPTSQNQRSGESKLTSARETDDTVRTILVVGGGYAGFYTAWTLEKKLRRDEARVIVVDPRP